MISCRHVPAHAASVFQLKLYWLPELSSSREPGVSAGAIGPLGAFVVQSICCDANTAAVSGAPPCSESVNFVGTVEPPFALLSACGGAMGGWKPPSCAVHVTGRSNAATPSLTLFELPCTAEKPRPRFAKPRQTAHWFSPPVSARSAARIPFRPSTKPGLQGCIFSPSDTSRR